jgi:hypothetical protein
VLLFSLFFARVEFGGQMQKHSFAFSGAGCTPVMVRQRVDSTEASKLCNRVGGLLSRGWRIRRGNGRCISWMAGHKKAGAGRLLGMKWKWETKTAW